MAASKVPVSEEGKQRSYYKYYLREIAEVPAEKLELLDDPFGDPADALRIEDRNKIFDPGYLPGEKGIFMLENGTAVVANMTEFPGTKGEMLQWWFAWHGVEPTRYAIWDPYDHYGLEVSEEDRAKMIDPDLSVREKCYNVHHTVYESLVTGEAPDRIEIDFRDPADMGMDASKIGTDACSFMVIANTTLMAPDGSGVPVVMMHMARDTDYGCELRSRFWMGYNIIDGEPVKLIPDGMEFPKPILCNLLAHNFKEYTNLSVILPEVYAEEKDNWA